MTHVAQFTGPTSITPYSLHGVCNRFLLLSKKTLKDYYIPESQSSVNTGTLSILKQNYPYLSSLAWIPTWPYISVLSFRRLVILFKHDSKLCM